MTPSELFKNYLPMSETAYYILLSLTQPRHGYGVMQYVAQLTGERVMLGPGTLYGSIAKMERDGILRFVSEENKRKTYTITPTGFELLEMEIARITELYENAARVKAENQQGGWLQ